MNYLENVFNNDKLINIYGLVDSFIMKSYMNKLSDYKVKKPEELINNDISKYVRLAKINKMVYDKNESVINKLSNVYNVLAETEDSLILLLISNKKGVEFYIGTRAKEEQYSAQNYIALTKSFLGNFPGSDIENVKNTCCKNLINELFSSTYDIPQAISSVSGVASLKDENKDKFVQGLEKLIDTMKGEEYFSILVANPIQRDVFNNIRTAYEELYTEISPLANTQISYGFNESNSVTEGWANSITESLSESLSNTQSYSNSTSNSSAISDNKRRNIITSTFAQIFGGSLGSGSSKSVSSSLNEGLSNTAGETNTNSTSKQENKSESSTKGSSSNFQVSFENKSITKLLERIDDQLKRIKRCEELGMWNCASYFISKDASISKIAANTYKALMMGENSSTENSCVNTWFYIHNDEFNNNNLKNLAGALKNLTHPLIDISKIGEEALPDVTPGTLISGYELSLQGGLPLKAVSGLPVIHCASFGRDVITYDCVNTNSTINIGKIFHMGSEEDGEVNIDIESLTMHTFITGATGSGKSNAIYQLIEKLTEKAVKFLVIEPAKGEYKQVFGGRADVMVFGTNPQKSNVLKLNPFQFSNKIHILEHIERLIEIFNASWPMYAAMPEVLKESIEKVYIDCGWDMDESVNYYEKPKYPTFKSLIEVMPEVIKKSEYSEEVKGNYIGALVTRVKSMTNGINGNIFVEEEIPGKILFEENCIIDLSRVNSPETKSLIMGMLIMKMQEYRVETCEGTNAKLKHVTILEEAHNLLRKTSLEQSQEGSNLQGKAVELLSNSIAEMRTYGEGFIIVDQAPGLLDMSAIRNTNTKIILRLPDEGDRQLVGKAANLNSEQITELAKLKVGVAAIYQNNWIQPVLCKMNKFLNEIPLKYEPKISLKNYERKMLGILITLLLNEAVRKDLIKGSDLELISFVEAKAEMGKWREFIVEELKMYYSRNNMSCWQDGNMDKVAKCLYEILDGDLILAFALDSKNLKQWHEKVTYILRNKIELNKNVLLEMRLIEFLLRANVEKGEKNKKHYYAWLQYKRENNMF